MLRYILSFLAFNMIAIPSYAQQSKITPRTQEAIAVMQALCLASSEISIETKGNGKILILKKGVKIEGEYKETEVVSLLKKLQSEVNLLEEADKIRACMQPHIDKILNSVLGLTANKKPPSITSKNDTPVALFLKNDRTEYLKGTLCKNQFNYMKLILSYSLSQMNNQDDSSSNGEPYKFIANILNSTLNLGKPELVIEALREIDLKNLDCTIERTCEIHGSVPIDIRPETMSVFENPMHQVKVLAGQCKDKIGYVDERFIEF